MRGTYPSPPGRGGGRAAAACGLTASTQEAAAPVWGPGHPLSWVPAPGGEGSLAEVSLAGAGVPSPARPGPAQHSSCGGWEMGVPQRPPQAGGPSAPKSRSHLVCAGDGVSRESAAVGTLGNSLRQRQGCRGAQGLATGCSCGEASWGAGALGTPDTSTPPEASPGAGGPGRWRGSPREAASGRRWEAPSNNGLKIEQAAPEEADPSGEGVGAGRLPARRGPRPQFLHRHHPGVGT